jgi:hypothetical protein
MLTKHFLKYSSYRLDVSPKQDELQQTDRFIFPALALWADGTKYNAVGFMLAWWKWKLHVFFKVIPC